MSLGPALAVIPARAGSTRVLRKNVRRLQGKALVAWTIEAAVESGVFDEVVVSTDAEEIAGIADRCGVRVHRRSPDLADHVTPSSLVTVDVLEQAANHDRFQSVAQLLPTSPFRSSDDVRRSFEHFGESSADSCLSVVEVAPEMWWTATIAGGRLRLLHPDQVSARSQDLPVMYGVTGAIWWSRPDVLVRSRSFYSDDMAGFPVSQQAAHEIDTEDDWRVAVAIAEALRA